MYELDSVKAKRLADVARHKESIEIISKEVSHLEDALLKAKAAHMKSVQDVKRYQEKLRALDIAVEEAQNMPEEKKREKEKESKQLMGRFLSAFESTPEQEREKCLKKLAKYEAEVQAKSNDIATKKKWLLDAIAKRDEIYTQVSPRVHTLLDLYSRDSLTNVSRRCWHLKWQKRIDCNALRRCCEGSAAWKDKLWRDVLDC